MTVRRYRVLLPSDLLGWGVMLAIFSGGGVAVLWAGHGAQKLLALIPLAVWAIFGVRCYSRWQFSRSIWTYTRHGVGIRMAARRPVLAEIAAIEAGTEAAIKFWQTKYPLVPGKIAPDIPDRVNGVLATLQPEVTRQWQGATQKLDGMQIPRAIIVAYAPGVAFSKLEAAVRHEMGHLIVSEALGIEDATGGEVHHALFKKEGFA